MSENERKKPSKPSPKKGDNRVRDPYADRKNGNKQPSQRPRNFAYQLVPYILAVLALFLLLCFITNLICNQGNVLGEEGRENEHIIGVFGYYICEVIFGVFGHAAFAIPVVFVMFVIFWKNYTRRSFVALNGVLAFVAIITISSLIHIFINMGVGIEAFSNKVDLLYADGAALRGGGIIGGIVSFALVSVLQIVGSIFVLLAILVPVLMFLAGTTPVAVAGFIVTKIKAAIEKSREGKSEEEEAEEEERREAKRLAKEEKKRQKELARAERDARRSADFDDEDEDYEDDDDNGDEKLSLPEGFESENKSKNDKRNSKTLIKVNSDADESDDLDDADEDDKLKITVFTNEEKRHLDSIKPNLKVKINNLNDDEDDEKGAAVVFPSDKDGKDTVVFVDPNDSGKKARGVGAVDHMVTEIFDDDEDVMVDTNTGEVFKPVVSNKKPKSANEFREMNEVHEEQFIGEKPEPEPIPEYVYPTVDLLEMGSSKFSTDPAEIEENAGRLRDVLQDFKIPVKEISCSCGPTITRYEIKPEAGVRVRQIANLVDDISLALAKSGVRIEAPIPGKAAVGIEVPNDKPSSVKLRNLIETPEFTEHKSKIAACLGADVSGKPVIFDIEKMPHLLVAGTTGSGKSVCINSIIMSILYHAKPNEVKLLLIDPKQVEFQIYKNIPHLCCRIISDPKKAAGALNSAVNEMEKRFELIKEVGVRNITGYNEVTKNDPDKPYMPRMVVIIDEFADLMMTAKDEVETAVVRIAQKARAAGIHLIIGTQRPSVDVITGLIKANIPSRIAFTVMSGTDSRTILDTVGAEKLCGRGDMLYAPVGAAKPQRVQGTFVSDEEVEKVVDFVRDNNAPVIYDNEFESLIEMEAAKCGNAPEKSGGGGGEFKGGSGDEDPKLFDAMELAIDAGKISTSLLQRRLEVGYGRAAKIIDRLEEMGMVGPADGTKPRKILITREELEERRMNE